MKPLRAQMIHERQLQRLAPKTQKAYVTAVAGLAKFYECSPDRLSPEQMRTSLHHLLVERRLAWSSCNQAAAGLKFFYTQTLGWDVLHLNLPPRTGCSQLPQILSIEELQRLCMHARNPRHRVLLMTTYAAGLRVGEVVRLRLTDIESDRLLLRVEQGTGRKDRYTLLSTRLLTELRAYWEVASLVSGAGPALLRLPGREKPSFLALLGRQRRRVLLLGPDLAVHRVPVEVLCTGLLPRR